MKAIKLTSINGSKLIVMVDAIACILTEKVNHGTDHGSTVCVHLVSGVSYSVKETADEIMIMMGLNNGG